MRGLNAAESQFSADDGAADPVVSAALAAYAAGQGSEFAALTALARCRLLVPVVAVLAEAEDAPTDDPAPAGERVQTGARVPAGDKAGGRPGDKKGGSSGDKADDGAGDPGLTAGLRREKSTEMALPTLIGRDGRPAVIAFTSLDALTRWRPDARPVPVPAASVWLAGIQDASAVVIDVAGPVPVAVDGARLAALAAGRPVPMPHQDPDVLAALQAVLADEPLIAQAALTTPDQRVAEGMEPGDPGDPALPAETPAEIHGETPAEIQVETLAGDSAAAADDDARHQAPATADLALQVTLAHAGDQAAAAAAAQRIVAALLAATGGRLRRGVEVSVIHPGYRTGQA